MISGLGKLAKVSKDLDKSLPTRFNSSLPITIEVLKRHPLQRYLLRLGTKEFTTKSQKELEEGSYYWGNFGETKNGIIEISTLIKKPDFFQKTPSFLDIDGIKLFEEFEKNPQEIMLFKEQILHTLAKPECTKKQFLLLSTILLAFKKNIYHLPLKIDNRGTLIQFAFQDNALTFYAAFENLGPIEGVFYDRNNLQLQVSYEKSAFFLAQALKNFDIVSDIQIKREISPLYTQDSQVLNLKG